MTKYKCVGCRTYEAVNRNTGEHYVACNVYATYPLENESDGLGVKEFFCRFDRVSFLPAVGDSFGAFYSDRVYNGRAMLDDFLQLK